MFGVFGVFCESPDKGKSIIVHTTKRNWNGCVRLREANLKLSPKKCHFFKKPVAFLGHVFSEEGFSTGPEKITICPWLCYFSSLLTPENNKVFVRTSECDVVFQCLKQVLSQAPVLDYSTSESSFILDTDGNSCVTAARPFHHYVYRGHFKVRTDHSALRWLMNPEGRWQGGSSNPGYM